MAEKKDKAAAEVSRKERLQQGAKKTWGVLIWVGLAGAAVFVLYMLFIGGDPRRQYTTPEETLRGYTDIVQPYAVRGGIRPDRASVGTFLEFFDSESRDYFRENAPYMAALRLQFDEERFEAMSTQARRAEAMLYLLSRPPLDGFALVEDSEELEDGRVRLTVRTTRNTPHTLTMRRSTGLWYMEDMGGAREAIERDIGSIRERMRE